MNRTIALFFLATLFLVGITKSHPKPDPIMFFLKAYNKGDIDSINKFIENNYVNVITKSAKSFSDISISFGKLYDEFGPLEIHSFVIDKTYHSRKYFLKGVYTKEWVSIMLVLTKDSAKIAGHGIWKLQAPAGIAQDTISIKLLPEHLENHLKQLVDNSFFSGTVLISHQNKIIYNKAWGLKNEKDKMLLNTKMPIASITKLFTGIAISQLITQGKLSVDDPISKYIPEYPIDISSKVTVKHLLLHTSGIELDDCKQYNQSISKIKNINELINLHVTYIDSLNEGRRQNFNPLNKYDYSNEEYHLLGAIIERISQMNFEEYIYQNICKPLEMTNTNFESDSTLICFSHYNSQSDYCPTKWFAYTNKTTEPKTPSGGLYSTVDDLHKLLISLNDNKLFNSDWKLILTSDTVLINESCFYGYGVEVKSFGPYVSYGHNGGSVKGANAEFRYFPKEDLFIAIIANRSRAASDLLYYITNRLYFSN